MRGSAQAPGDRNHSENPVLLSLKGNFPPAILALADGTVFVGNSIGAAGSTVGEVVFNTSMTGYQEILTDPSYCQQIVTLTVSHVGNYGVNAEDIEADKIHAAGLIIKDLPLLASNFRSTDSLSGYLMRANTVAIANIDRAVCERQNGGRGGSLERQKHWFLRVCYGYAQARSRTILGCSVEVGKVRERRLGGLFAG